MATRKVKNAKDLSTDELIYFKGHAMATFMSDGTTVEDAINNIQGIPILEDVDEAPEDTPIGSIVSVVNDEKKISSIQECFLGDDNAKVITSIEINPSNIPNDIPESLVIAFAQTMEPTIFGVIQFYENGLVFVIINGEAETIHWLFANGEPNLDGINAVQAWFAEYGGCKYIDAGTNGEMSSESRDFLDSFITWYEGGAQAKANIKTHDGWNELVTNNDIVNNLTDGGIKKMLSAEMGKILNEKISGIVAGNTTEPIKFKGYVNVDGTTDVDKIYDSIQVGEACLVAPSIKDDNGQDSYVPWIFTATHEEWLPLGDSLLEPNISNILKGEIRTYFTLDESFPYWKCPDMLLLAKVKVRIKQFVDVIEMSSALKAALQLLPNNTEITVCIGKILHWSVGEYFPHIMSELKDLHEAITGVTLTNKYGWDYNADTALTNGIISYTSNLGANAPAKDWFTVFVTSSSDADSGGNKVITQTAYGRTGDSNQKVYTRLIFLSETNTEFLPWIQTDNNFLPNINGWLLSPNAQLSTGVYQTCNAYEVMDANGNHVLNNSYFTMFVNASTTPNGDGYNAIEQTAYGRDIDNGKIYQRVIFHKEGNDPQFGNWIQISVGNSSENSNNSGAYGLIEHGTSDLYFELTPNTLHVWGEVSSLVLTLGGEQVEVANEYLFQFTSGEEPTMLSLPNNILWANDVTPNIEPNKTYQISILNNFATIMKFNKQ
jgi:hypothetical protein